MLDREVCAANVLVAAPYDEPFSNKKNYFFFVGIFEEEDYREKGKLYKPQSKLEERSSNSEKSSSSSSKKESSSSSAKRNPKAQEKKKSNLELFKEELRQ